MSVVDEQQRRGRGRPAVGDGGPGRKSTARNWTAGQGQVAALRRELAEMPGMEMADLLRRIVSAGLEEAEGPGAVWSVPAAGARSMSRVKWVPGVGQLAALDERASGLSVVEGRRVTRNEVMRRMVSRWLWLRL